MSRGGDTARQIEREQWWRNKVAVPTAAGGVLYLLGGVTIFGAVAGRPVVGVLQALQPALNGKATSSVTPRLAGVRYLSSHYFSFISGSVLQAIGLAVLTVMLVFLMNATRARSEGAVRAARYLVPIGGGGAALLAVVHAVVELVNAHNFTHSHNHTTKAYEHAITYGAVNITVAILELFVLLALVVGMVLAVLAAGRVGLLPRWMRTVGIIGGVILLPIFAASYELDVVPAAFMVFVGIMLMGKLPGGDPPAWTTGEAVPWPPGRAVMAGAGRGDGDSNGAGDASAPLGSRRKRAGRR
jgi:hypothetical protein